MHAYCFVFSEIPCLFYDISVSNFIPMLLVCNFVMASIVSVVRDEKNTLKVFRVLASN